MAPTWSFHCLGPGEPFTRPYEKASADAPNFATVDPGDDALFVGGGALNGAIGKILSSECGETRRPLQDIDRYTALHETMLALAREQPPGTLLPASSSLLQEHGGLEWSGCRLFKEVFKSFGAVFIHIFKPESRPLGTHNVGMVYTVGPLGKNVRAEGEPDPEHGRVSDVLQDEAAFGAFLRKTANSIAMAVAEYNGSVAVQAGLPQIQKLRVPLISGGTFRHPKYGKKDCARSILSGIQDAADCWPNSSTLDINFSFDEGCFRNAANYLIFCQQFKRAGMGGEMTVEQLKKFLSALGFANVEEFSRLLALEMPLESGKICVDTFLDWLCQ